MSVRAAVFASGGGSNLQSLLDHEVPDGPYRVELIISDREDAGALERGRGAGREVVVISVMGRSKEEVEADTLETLSAHAIEAIFLAGYLRLIPGGVDNLIVASRCISSTHEAHSSLRVMPIVWTLGQAGGTAAAICLKKKVRPRDVDASELRRILVEQGAYI